ncbi:MAG TPA: dihydropteroate synthase [Longimicrobiales bacterium]
MSATRGAATATAESAGRVAAPRAAWRAGRFAPSLDRPRLLGILNVTPDSFSDGGRYDTLDAALARAEQLVAEGADALDVGGESTRPGAQSVDAAAERARVVPVIAALVRRFPEVPVTIDTVKDDVARAALDAGACAVNDVSGLRIDPSIAATVARANAGLILMHSRGGVGEMASYDLATYGEDPVGEIVHELATSLAVARDAGVALDAILLDPGLGFSKRTEHSVACLRELDRFRALGVPVLIGPSRKRFVGDLGGGATPAERLEGTIAACLYAVRQGAAWLRVHDVGPVRKALDVALALEADA